MTPTEDAKPVDPVAEAATPEPQTAKAPEISIHAAAFLGNIEAINQHLAAGADVNAKNDIGETLLHLAAYNDHKEIAELLIAEGADVNAKNDDGGNPLHYAAFWGHSEIAKLLIAKGANVNVKDDFYGTTVDSAERDLEDLANEDDSPEYKANKKETADLLRKHGGKTGEELKAEGK